MAGAPADVRQCAVESVARNWGLPIDEALPTLRSALAAHRNVVLQAPPGAGKSTVVPLALLDQPWVGGRRILMQEPRRLATRAIAARMAVLLGSPIGQIVGYRMRLDTRVSRATRIEVVTEGVLTRMLQSDPALEGTAAVVFDEFHERNLASDLALALCLDAQAQIAPDLRVLVMSATLDTSAVAQLLGDAPVISAAGREFPIETRYLGTGAPLLPDAAQSAARAVLLATLRALREQAGDVLVFLPGAAEIRRLSGALREALSGDVEGASGFAQTAVLPLYGDLAAEAQDEAIRPSRPGRRKVVLATNIAETSLTIEGIRVVVDSGLVRRSVFDPATGMSRLETQRISRDSAEQRQGRAGRLAPGVCYRLWSEGAQRSLAPFSTPEIAEADLAPLALDLAAWGTREAGELRWLNAPPAAMLSSARDLLARLGALDADGRITAHGRDLNRIAVHPRLAHMLVRAHALEGEYPGATHLAAEIAALLSERDLLRAPGEQRDADLRSRLAILHEERARLDPGVLQRMERAIVQLKRQLSADAPASSSARAPSADALVGALAAFAYPDRIGQRRPGAEARYALANGRGAYFAAPQPLAREALLVAIDLDDRERDARILLAAPLSRADLERHFPERLQRAVEVYWSERDEAVNAVRTLRLDALLLEERPLPDPPAEATRAAMLAGLRTLGLEALPWTPEARSLQARMGLFAPSVRTSCTAKPLSRGRR